MLRMQIITKNVKTIAPKHSKLGVNWNEKSKKWLKIRIFLDSFCKNVYK